jgi:hypothetical protein
LNRLVDLGEILYGDDVIEYYLDYILFDAVAPTIPKWRTFKLLSGWYFWTDWWIWMKFCMEMIRLKVTSTPYYLIP